MDGYSKQHDCNGIRRTNDDKRSKQRSIGHVGN
jgi:hypothetical protein